MSMSFIICKGIWHRTTQMEKQLALSILVSFFSPYPLHQMGWAERVDELVLQSGSKVRYYLEPVYSFGPLLFKEECKEHAAPNMGSYFEALKFSQQIDKSMHQTASEYSLPKELAYFLSKAHKDLPSDRNVLQALRMIANDIVYLDYHLKELKINDEQILYNRVIVEALLDADRKTAKKIVSEWIQVLGQRQPEYLNQLSELYSILATVYSYEGNQFQSLKAFKLAIGFNVNNLVAHRGIANTYLFKNKWKQINQHFTGFPINDSNLNFFKVAHILILALQGKYPACEEMLAQIKEQILANPSKQAEFFLYNLCCGWRDQTYFNFEQCLRHYERELLFNQHCLFLRTRIPYIAFKLGKYDTALKYCKIIKEKQAWCKQSDLLSIACYIKLNETEKAVKLLKSWQDAKHNVNTWYLEILIGIFNKLGLENKAIEYIQKFPYQSILDNLHLKILEMQTYTRVGNHNKAEKLFQQIFAIFSNQSISFIVFNLFHQLIYLIDYCFNRNLINKGKVLVKLIQNYIESVMTFNVKAAEEMKRQLLQRQLCDIEMLFYI